MCVPQNVDLIWGLVLTFLCGLLSVSDDMDSVVPRSRFLGDTGVPLPEFQGDIYKFWGTHQIFQIFTC